MAVSKKSQPRKKKTSKASGRPGARTSRKMTASAASTKSGLAPKRPRKKAASSSSKSAASGAQRLQKVLASAGIGSRRDCEELITQGRVEIDRQVVTKLGVRVDPSKQEIRLDGDVLRPQQLIYYAVNKPTGVLSTNRDPAGRMRVVDLVPPGTRLFTVGRLDKASEGLMLVTNDGELANRLAHPRYGVEKVYRVMVVGSPSPESLKKLRRGVHLADGVVRAKRLTVKSRKSRTSMLEMVLTEGRNREIRRMAASIGHKVTSLQRIAIGPLRLADMPPGAYRPLTSVELKKLKTMVTGGGSSRSSSKPKRGERRPAGKKASPTRGKTTSKRGKASPSKTKTVSKRGAARNQVVPKKKARRK